MKNKTAWTWADLIIPAFALALSIYYVTTIWNAPAMAQWYGGGLSIINIIFFAVALFCVLKSAASPKQAEKPRSPAGGMYNAVVLMSMIAAYIFLLPFGGYVLCSLGFMAGVMYFLRVRSFRRIAACSIFVTLLGFVLFVLVLNVAIPLDPVSEKVRLFILSFFA